MKNKVFILVVVGLVIVFGAIYFYGRSTCLTGEDLQNMNEINPTLDPSPLDVSPVCTQGINPFLRGINQIL